MEKIESERRKGTKKKRKVREREMNSERKREIKNREKVKTERKIER
jgi:hypothetical protein